ncbi:MAG: type II toxin-antitoxin system RelE/ParE family toxin [Acetobacteraceae bacterium]|nr:type II toxin-antitoxin system RelE/ParE family toxin [Acetobacteraceae bacterium]
MRFTRPAEDDLRAAVAFIARDNPAAARHVEARVRSAARVLVEHPEIGWLSDAESLRRWQIPGTPYRLLYSVSADRITITRIWHGARGWPPAS